MDLFETDEPAGGGSNTPEYSVSELSRALKKTVETHYGHVRVRGELGRVTRASSGHMYLDLKDDKSVINCNIWRPVVQRLEFDPEEGMEVIATGKLSTYAPRSGYNLIIDSLEIAGAGALMALLEKRKNALRAEGLFDDARKQKIPFIPEKIGVITSRTGAVIRDILHRLQDRFPREVLLWPVAVQGKTSAEEVTAAIRGFNALPLGDPLRPDVIIIARGGGSIEDLWGFNEEIVVRAVASSRIPIISAVGHETDNTLVDLVADMRAPTPSAAAEMSVPVRADLLAHVQDLDARRLRSLQKLKEIAARRLQDLARALPKPSEILAHSSQRLDLAATKLMRGLERQSAEARARFSVVAHRVSPRVVQNFVDQKSKSLEHVASRLLPATHRQTERAAQKLTAQMRLLQALSYTNILDRGFALVLNEKGDILKSSAETRQHQSVTIRQKDGETQVKIDPQD